ncbi:hypothetical protein D039_1431A, partial [Vibrio parahaemolyticus EKP-028]
MAGIS